MSRSILFITTPTSGTGSLQRLINALRSKEYKYESIGQDLAAKGKLQELKSWIPEAENHIYYYNTPQIWEPRFSLHDYRVIVNFRDPRDLNCNQYYWLLAQHPQSGKSEQQAEEHRQRVREMGINKYARTINNNVLYVPFFDVLKLRDTMPGNDCLILSYSQLCLDYDRMIAKLMRFFGRNPSPELKPIIERERVDNLKLNPQWIGHKWQGADIVPGRHRLELDAETIEFLTARYKKTLEMLIALDEPEFAAQYR